MKDSTRIAREKKTVKIMIEMYCNAHHGKTAVLCRECSSLYDYAINKIDKCPFHEKKPVCGKCPVHCYKPEMREKMCAVMRYSGPKILMSHPVQGMMHIIDRFRYRADKYRRP
jgi:ribosomal protein L40E